MNLSTDTLAILKNFSEINNNILFKPGSKLNTISAMKNILAEATITEKFDTEHEIPVNCFKDKTKEKPTVTGPFKNPFQDFWLGDDHRLAVSEGVIQIDIN